MAVWDEVKGRMRKGQEIRRRQHITKGRRVTLTKSTLASMSLYLMWIHREENSFGEVGYKVFGEEAHGSSALSSFFPTLFDLAINKSKKVAEVWDQFTGNGSWNLRFVRDFNDCESNLVGNLQGALQNESINSIFDKVIRKGS